MEEGVEMAMLELARSHENPIRAGPPGEDHLTHGRVAGTSRTHSSVGVPRRAEHVT